MKRKESEANSELRRRSLEVRQETAARQQKEISEFLTGDGIIVKRYNKEAIKRRVAYLRKNRKQLEDARKQSIISRSRKKRARQAERHKEATRATRRKFAASGAGTTEAVERWAEAEAKRILSSPRS